LDTLGLMLPYTPLHHLLLRAFGGPLVMTSGNVSEEPIAIGNREAVRRLGEIADDLLLHDRDIYARYDDSVVRVIGEDVVPLRRARGFAPTPLDLPFSTSRDILACGAQQKATFCLVKEAKAFISQHIGDLENLETLEHYQSSLDTFRRLFKVEPQLIAHDMHPDYLSSHVAHDFPAPWSSTVSVTR
jgi:hydrogenase maturation protein HypF